ncbi:MAG TPA: hypothetical protein VK464_11335 [Symbiobacteriaceae bacterium]|jgi:hypothetical protein|nr:hypothetical protein [Symbiobacteriaceae bacterium]
MILILLLLALVVPAVLALIGLQMADDRDEELLFWKLFGYAFLGAFTFKINGFPLPVGFVIALIMAGNAAVNKKPRQVVAIIAFVLMLLGLLF